MPTDQIRSISSITRAGLSSLMLVLAAMGTLSAQQTGALPQWMTADSANRTVSLELRVDGAAGSPATIAGYRQGGVQVVVPLGWTVRWRWINGDSTAAHSLVVMAEREKLPAEGGSPVFDNAMSRNVVRGLGPGKTDETTFTADQAGWYWLLCGVPGHALGGEWIGLKVDREAKTPGIAEKGRD
ncbi:MAG TPA: sulfocyanin-like copper-binding protein [Gemmatimonadales bacterium]|nr:sulfocyanin-like copper-binding protein [Gemmatimonadales bacterium]